MQQTKKAMPLYTYQYLCRVGSKSQYNNAK